LHNNSAFIVQSSAFPDYNPLMPGEFDLIKWIYSQQRPTDLVRNAAGDDLAVMRWPREEYLLVGNDQVLDGVHFDSTQHSPEQIGRKAMNRNLSDCAAMACMPAAAVTTFALPRSVDLEYAKALYLGMKEAADEFDCAIIGGDTASWNGKLVVTVTILGRSDGIEPLTRRGARPGDGIYVSGALGGSILGRHMTFQPKIGLGRQLARAETVTSMIDLSDGLSRDLRHICQQSNVGAMIYSNQIPIHPDAITLSQQTGKSPLEHALHDGEDYELLYTSPRQLPPRAGTRIGQITLEKTIELQGPEGPMKLDAKGWEHQIG
jgi:thiamine-monophosphate kinase